MAHSHAFFGVQLKQKNRRPPHGRESHDAGTIQGKMLGPTVAAGMEEWYDGVGVRVHGGEVWTLATITVGTGQRQVLLGGGAAVLHGDDVIGFVLKKDVLFVDEAILAALPGAAWRESRGTLPAWMGTWPSRPIAEPSPPRPPTV